ncbi:MAG TPA: ATP-binding protein [Candidatus Binataceae bacterium]|nr:ATP-binding protein [Candidatus Binataceae bacterium]
MAIELSAHSRAAGPREWNPGGSDGAIGAEIGAIAAMAAGMFTAGRCRIVWHCGAENGISEAPEGSRGDLILDAVLAVLARYPAAREARSDGVFCLGPDDLGPIGRRPSDSGRLEAAIAAVGNPASGAAHATVALIAPAGYRAADLKAAAELAARAVIGLMRSASGAASREFWQRRASDTATRLSRVRADTTAGAAEERRIAAALAAAGKLRPRHRYTGLGSIFAALGPFDAWIVASVGNPAGGDRTRHDLSVAASSGVLAAAAPTDRAGPLAAPSALAECFRRQVTMVRAPRPGQRGAFGEDRLFAQFPAYLCVPLVCGAIGLAARQAPEEAVVARLERLAAGLEPLVRAWSMEAEIAGLHGLVRSLGMRMFGAIDAERARIARDLHDHQAQLLAAARIAIEAGPDEARGVFKQLEDALRLRVRELRPATLGRSTLEDGLRYELRRLADAGIKGRLMHAERMAALTRPVQQVCYQVAREALANVMRHAGASRVEIAIEKRGGRVRLSIRDNGHGMRAGASPAGMGLSGLGERLELMGGRLRVESKIGATRLIAELPETV